MINRKNVLSLLSTLRNLEEGFEAGNEDLINYVTDWAQTVALDDSAENLRLDFLAAAKLNYLLAVRAASESAVSFRAGDVSVNEDGFEAIKAAKEILDSALGDADALVNLKRGFAFIGV